MSLIFLGAPGIQHYIGDDGKDATRPAQQFMSGVMVFNESYIEDRKVQVPKLDEKGAVIKNADGTNVLVDAMKKVQVNKQHVFKPNDIGQPYSAFKDETDVMARYPQAFKKG